MSLFDKTKVFMRKNIWKQCWIGGEMPESGGKRKTLRDEGAKKTRSRTRRLSVPTESPPPLRGPPPRCVCAYIVDYQYISTYGNRTSNISI